MAWLKGSVGVEEQGMYTGGPPGTWEALSFPPSDQRLGKPQPKEPRPARRAPIRVGANNRTQGGTAKRRKRSEAGRTAGIRSSQ